MSTLTETAPPQHMRALDRANYVRLGRVAVKRAIAAGERTVVDVLRDTPEVCVTMTVFELLQAQDRWGKVRARRLLATIPLTEQKALCTLSPRQRAALIARLSGEPVADPFPRHPYSW